MGSMDKEASFKLLDAYYEAGGNFIDTADNYQDEQNRDQLVIATKFTTDYKSYDLGKRCPPAQSAHERAGLAAQVGHGVD